MTVLQKKQYTVPAKQVDHTTRMTTSGTIARDIPTLGLVNVAVSFAVNDVLVTYVDGKQELYSSFDYRRLFETVADDGTATPAEL
jgi:hypothetical protein